MTTSAPARRQQRYEFTSSISPLWPLRLAGPAKSTWSALGRRRRRAVRR